MPSSRSPADTDDLFAQAAAGADSPAVPDTADAAEADDPDAWFAAAAAEPSPQPAPASVSASARLGSQAKPFEMAPLHAAGRVLTQKPEPIVGELALALLSSQRSGGAYARFVPGEEIQAAEPWAFSAVDPRERARELAALAERDRAQIDVELQRELQQQLQRERLKALDEGHAQGTEAARQEAQRAHRAEIKTVHEQHRQTLADLVAQFQSAIGMQRDAQAQAVLQLACDIARQVLRREIQTDAQSLMPVIHEVLALVDEDAQRITVHLHPDDLAAVQAAAQAAASSALITWVPDTTVDVGGCRVLHAGTTIDATLPTRWQRVIASLGLDAQWDPVPGARPDNSAGGAP